MALVMTPIYTQTVGAGGVTSVAFNSIPQFFTDLKIVASVRDTGASAYAGGFLRFNGDTSSIYSTTLLEGYGVAASSRTSNAGSSFPVPHVTGGQATANIFGSIEIYLPNYTGSNHKQALVDSVSENNSATNFLFHLGMSGLLYRSSSPITAIQLFASTAFAQHSTISLYGIIRSGA